jgi:hypothetical protein
MFRVMSPGCPNIEFGPRARYKEEVPPTEGPRGREAEEGPN